MAKEIERKFLINADKIDLTEYPGVEIQQGYLSDYMLPCVRIRIADNNAFLTVKGRNYGNTRDEFEYEIPMEDATVIMRMCGYNTLFKTRYLVGRWEVDVFHRNHLGLIIAEIELKSEDEKIKLPDWIGEEVSSNPEYFNFNLIFNNNLGDK